MSDRSVSVQMTLSDLERRDVMGQFLADLHYYAHTVWRIIIEISVVRQVGRSTFLGGHYIYTPPSKGGGAQRPQFWGTPTYAETLWLSATKFGTITQVRQDSVSWGCHAPSQRGGVRRPQFFSDSHLRPNGLTRSDRIRCDNIRSVCLGVPNLMGQGHSVHQMCGTSRVCAHSIRNDKQTLHGYQTTCRPRENFYGVDHEWQSATCLRQLTILLNNIFTTAHLQ